jgi:NAD-dependent deacetylase
MPETTLHEVAEAVVDRIRPGAVVVASTGAGLSKASGISTFRGPEGLWQTVQSEDIATLEMLERHPELFWRFHDRLRAMIVDAVPNPAHFVLADMEEALEDAAEFAVITQNIDRLHQRAGSRRVIELHGDALAYECMGCGDEIEAIPVPAPECPPRCPKCRGVVRPRVVLFGEALPEDSLDEAQGLCGCADVLFVVGTSALVQPAAALPLTALSAGALVIEVNPSTTPLTGLAQYSIQAPAGPALPALWERIQLALRER